VKSKQNTTGAQSEWSQGYEVQKTSTQGKCVRHEWLVSSYKWRLAWWVDWYAIWGCDKRGGVFT